MIVFKKNIFDFALLLSSLLMLIGTNPIQAETHPSFDCRKATTEVEKAICAHTDFAYFDARMEQIWKILLTAFDDDGMKARLRQDQAAWLTVRNNCKENSACIGDAYRNRLSQLGFEGKQSRFSGQYEAKNIGDITLYPTADPTYLLAIHTADPEQGAWTCVAFGTATGKDSTLSVTVGDDSFVIKQTDAGTLLIDANDQVLAVAQKYCGLNGGFSFTYHRLPL